MRKTYFIVIVISVILGIGTYTTQTHDCCSRLDYRCSAARRYIIDRTGYWVRARTSEPRSYAYTNSVHRDESTSTRIITLNYQRVNYATRRWFHIWSGGNPWFKPDRIWRFHRLIEHFRPDIIGLQEVTPGMAVGLANLVSPDYAFAQVDDIGYTELANNPILYKKNRYTVQDVSVPLYKSETSSEYHGDTTLITQATFADEKTDKLLTVNNVHVGAVENEGSRDRQKLSEIAQTARINDHPWYIVGDFNAYIPRVENMLSMNSAYQGTTSTYISWDTEKETTHSIIDGILYPNNDAALCNKSDVIVYKDEVSTDGAMHHDQRLSDHRPVLADFNTNHDS